MAKLEYADTKKFLSGNYIAKENVSQVNPKSIALRTGLISYYETYSIYANSRSTAFFRYLEKAVRHEIIISGSYGTDYVQKYYSAITNIHSFFEFYIKEILENTSPVLAKLFDNSIDLVKAFTQDFSQQSISSKYVDYKVALDRLKALIEHHRKVPKNFRIKTKYHFLAAEYETLNTLRELRNVIIHSGVEVLNRYAFETFMVNHVIPLIRRILRKDKRNVYLERGLHCKLNVIDELCKIKLEEKSFGTNDYNSLLQKLHKINHLKELGRASFIKNVMIAGEAPSFRFKHEKLGDKKKRQDAMYKASFIINKLDHFKLYKCPCCGTKSITSFDYWQNYTTGRVSVQTIICHLCSYKININIGEPSDFGIMKDKVFVTVRQDKN